MILAPSSLRNRLVLGAVAVGVTFAVLFGAAATWRVHHARDQAVRSALQSRVELARDEVASDGTISQDAGSPKTDLVQVLGPDGRIRGSSPALAGAKALTNVSTVTRSGDGVEARVALENPHTDLVTLAVPLRVTKLGDSPAGTGALVVASDAEGFEAATSDLLELLLTGLVAVVLAMVGLSWLLTGRALASVTRIAESAEQVRPKDLASGLPVPRGDSELARLVEALNRMLARLDRNHATELAFAADAGHRLRTPVATLRAEAELALREQDPVALTAALQRVVQDADQLASIVDRMLARSRAYAQGPEPVLEWLTTATGRWHRWAQLADITVSVAVDERLSHATSCAELPEILEPILDNALRHTPPGGSVLVETQLDHEPPGTLVISVSNTGDPIPADLAPHVFDAWVSTRDASVAGGLGLWLARETARDAGGDVELVDDHLHATTTFRITLPTTHRV
ncbi:MAG: cusS 2 [Marmoricola sp.]|nr:cusS 2 [Marmoricola sp.]